MSIRIDCSVPIEGKENGFFSKTKTIDFSKGGIGIISKSKIPVNKEIAVEIDFGAQEESALAIGKVVWVKAITKSDKYRLGLCFKSIKRGSKSRLNKYFKK